MPAKRASLRDRPLAEERAARASDDALLGTAIVRQEVQEIGLREIMPNRWQPRSAPQEANLQELAESIRLHGVVQPIVVRLITLTAFEGSGRRYELVAGERRWRASILAGKTTVPALVQELDDQQMLELAIIENLQREDLNPLDEARALGRLRVELGYSFQQIAERLGRSKGYVQNRMELLDMPADVQELVASRPDAMSHARLLAKIIDTEMRADLIGAVRDDALSLHETRERVQFLTEDRAVSPITLPEAEDKSYLRKYDPVGEAAQDSSYLRKYDESIESQSGASLSPTEVALKRLQGYAAGLQALAPNGKLLEEERAVALGMIEDIERAVVALRELLSNS